MFRCCALIVLALQGCLKADEVTDSVVPRMEEVESGLVLRGKHYGQRQWLEMQALLDRTDARIRVVSFNVLFPIYDKKLSQQDRWPQRKARLLTAVQSLDADILCVQEPLRSQIEALQSVLSADYGFFGRGAFDGRDSGEVNGIFYRRARFELLKDEVLWMSPTPQRVSKDPFGRLTTLTLGTFRDRLTGSDLLVANTHLSFGNVDSREYQTQFLAAELSVRRQELPVILTGDLNAFPQWIDGDFPFRDGQEIHRTLLQAGLQDSYDWALLGHLGPFSTFTNQPPGKSAFKGTGTPGARLDRVYVSPDVTVLLHAVDPIKVNGRFPSDHMPVIVDLLITDGAQTRYFSGESSAALLPTTVRVSLSAHKSL